MDRTDVDDVEPQRGSRNPAWYSSGAVIRASSMFTRPSRWCVAGRDVEAAVSLTRPHARRPVARAVDGITSGSPDRPPPGATCSLGDAYPDGGEGRATQPPCGGHASRARFGEHLVAEEAGLGHIHRAACREYVPTPPRPEQGVSSLGGSGSRFERRVQLDRSAGKHHLAVARAHESPASIGVGRGEPGQGDRHLLHGGSLTSALLRARATWRSCATQSFPRKIDLVGVEEDLQHGLAVLLL